MTFRFYRTAIVTGGTRGLGLGIVQALADKGVDVTVVARNAADLPDVAPGRVVGMVAADVTDRDAAVRIVSEVRPDVLILNAGATPAMASLAEQTWEQFKGTWDTDVKAGLHWIQAALAAPLAPGSRVLVMSSGAALAGSPMTGRYAGAKRMLWIMANYADKLAAERGLDIRFQTIVPRQQIADTGIGDVASEAYGAKLGITPGQFLERFGAPLPPRALGELVAELLLDPAHDGARAFNLRGDDGLTVLEAAP